MPLATLPAQLIARYLDHDASSLGGQGKGPDAVSSLPLKVVSFNAQTMLSLARRNSFDRQLGELGVAIAGFQEARWGQSSRGEERPFLESDIGWVFPAAASGAKLGSRTPSQ